MEEIELNVFQLISNVGMAKSKYMEAFQNAKNKEYKKASNLITEGEEFYIKGHGFHLKLMKLTSDVSEGLPLMLLMHAEDQLMAAETVKILAEELILVYEELNHIKESI